MVAGISATFPLQNQSTEGIRMANETNHTMVRVFVLGAALMLQSGCGFGHQRETTPIVLFKDLFEQSHITRLAFQGEMPNELAAAALVTNAEIALVDERASDM